MRALLLKDGYVLWKQARFFFLFILVFSLIPGTFYNLFAVCYASMLSYTAMAYDERSHWTQLSAMMPYRVQDLVLSRYVVGWVCILGAGLLSLFAPLIGQFLPSVDGYNGSTVWNITLLSVSMAFLLLSVMLPMMFRFGVERARLMMLVCILLMSIGCGFLGMAVQPFMGNDIKSAVSLAKWILPALAIAANALSVQISIKLYRKRT